MNQAKFTLGQRVRKSKGSAWEGTIVGTYSTALTPEGYAVESSAHAGSVQIYPAAALEPAEKSTETGCSALILGDQPVELTRQPTDAELAALIGAMSIRPPIDIEQMIRECVPGGSICDPQAVADAIREYARGVSVVVTQQPRQPLTDHEMLDLMPPSIPAQHDGALMKYGRAVERACAETWGVNLEGGAA